MISFLSYRSTRDNIKEQIGNLEKKEGRKLSDLETFNKIQELFQLTKEY